MPCRNPSSGRMLPVCPRSVLMIVLSTPAASMCLRRSSASRILNLDSFTNMQSECSILAPSGEPPHVVHAGVDDLFRMIDHEALHAAALGLLEHKPDLAHMQVPGGEHHVVLGDDVEHFLHLVQHLAVARRPAPRSRAASSWWWPDAPRLISSPRQMIFRRERRQPDDLAAHRGGVLDRVGVEAAHHVVEHDARIELGRQVAVVVGDQLRGRDARIVVVLGHHRRHAGIGRLLQQLDMIEAARCDRRARMDVRIDRAAQQLLDLLFACRGRFHGSCSLNLLVRDRCQAVDRTLTAGAARRACRAACQVTASSSRSSPQNISPRATKLGAPKMPRRRASSVAAS